MSNIIVAFFSSLVASVVCWFCFEFLLKRKAQNKVQPLIDYDLYHLYQKLFSLLTLPFRPTLDKESQYAEEIRQGVLTKKDYYTFLSTKCLKEDYKRIDEQAKTLIPIGDVIQNIANEISVIVSRLYIFNHFLTAQQIILCRKVLDNLNLYSYDSPAYEKVEGLGVLHVVNPTINYMAEMFVDVSDLFLELQRFLMKSNSQDMAPYYQRSLDYIRVQSLFANKQYKRVATLTKNPKNGNLSSYYFRSLILMNKKTKAKQALVNYLKSTNYRLVFLRSSFAEVIQDEVFKTILIKERSTEEYEEMLSYLEKDAYKKEQFTQIAERLRDYYDNKCRYQRK
jgi:hypothetical protein